MCLPYAIFICKIFAPSKLFNLAGEAVFYTHTLITLPEIITINGYYLKMRISIQGIIGPYFYTFSRLLSTFYFIRPHF
jgi:hypothetical protein